MFDVFTEEIEVLVKDGIANLYWFREDLRKAWLRSGISPTVCDLLLAKKREDGSNLSKRELMDGLYLQFRQSDFDRRLESSRNFVRILIEHKSFVPQQEKHRIEIAERSSLKLKEILRQQKKEQEGKDALRAKALRAQKESYDFRLTRLRERFDQILKLDRQKRGYELEKFFGELMGLSGIPVEEPFRIMGEQIDGAIKYDGHYYLLELKWIEKKVDGREMGSFYLKIEGKMDARGIFVSMNGFSKELLASLPRGKEFKAILLDGTHLMNVICGVYTFQNLLEHAISEASLRGEIYCSHNI
ncbi:restriction endonuclease, partial [Desulfosporosinus sp. I2]|uniref:restriction endonuclease n=1 Tax=Desulfosporosinus sp. I2 TaxID=1617025 RepID=UPI0005EDEB2B